MEENKIADLSMDFVVGILKLTDNIKGHKDVATQKFKYDETYIEVIIENVIDF